MTLRVTEYFAKLPKKAMTLRVTEYFAKLPKKAIRNDKLV